jgi:SAM-dependent methyltransferase
MEQRRIADLWTAVPSRGVRALDVGCRDGFFSSRLTDRFERVTALDLVMPSISHDRIDCVEGDITRLPFPDGYFDFVVCAEVLEHIPGEHLCKACEELSRVARSHVLVGVPYRQDLRCGRTVCAACKQRNPPWGHVNSFDEIRLVDLFPGLQLEQSTFVGQTREVTSSAAAYLMDAAGNPYGTYEQDEPCIGCGATLVPPPPPTVRQRVLVKSATILDRIQRRFIAPRGNWIHLLFRKPAGS